jgi:hypothetical protein
VNISRSTIKAETKQYAKYPASVKYQTLLTIANISRAKSTNLTTIRHTQLAKDHQLSVNKRGELKMKKADYERLKVDLKQAANFALAAACKVKDDGTCNLDGIYLRLKSSNKEQVNNCIKESGLWGFKTRHSWYGTGYLINPPSVGQAYKREKAAEVMYKYFTDHGYDVSHWQQMD